MKFIYLFACDNIITIYIIHNNILIIFKQNIKYKIWDAAIQNNKQKQKIITQKYKNMSHQ